MIIEDLIEKLQEVQKNHPGAQVCTFDWRQSLHHSGLGPTPEGIDAEFGVEVIDIYPDINDNEDDPTDEDSYEKWVALSHSNAWDYDEDGTKLE